MDLEGMDCVYPPLPSVPFFPWVNRCQVMHLR